MRSFWKRKKTAQQEKEKYAFITGRIRCLENKLLKQTQLRDLLQTYDPDKVQQVLDALAYPQAPSLLQRIEEERAATDQFLRSNSPSLYLSQVFLLYQSYHNLKTMAKYLLPAYQQSVSQGMKDLPRHEQISERLLSQLYCMDKQEQSFVELKKKLLLQEDKGLQALWRLCLSCLKDEKSVNAFSKERWQALEEGGQLSEEEAFIYLGLKKDEMLGEVASYDLPLFFQEAFLKARQEYIERMDIGVVDRVLDYVYYLHLNCLARASEDAYLLSYARLRTQLALEMVLYRALRLNLPSDVAQMYWVPNETYDRQAFLRKLQQQEAARKQEREADEEKREVLYERDHFTQTSYASKQVQSTPTGGLTLKQDQELMRFARQGLESIYGPEVLGGYWLAKQIECQNLRILLSLFSQGQASAYVEKWMREVYIHG